jgi:hypothetical protein
MPALACRLGMGNLKAGQPYASRAASHEIPK